MKILNFGSLNIDHVFRVEHFVRPGETISVKSLADFCGGKGLNQSVALARAGADVWHAGCVGTDGGMLLDMLRESAVNTTLMQQENTASGSTVIQVDDSGQNCILVYGGTNVMLTEEYIDRTIANFAPGDWLLVQNEVNNVGYIIRAARNAGMKIAFNPSPVEGSANYPLELVDLFLVNELEAAALCGLSGGEDFEQTIRTLGEKYPNAETVMTIGSKGALYFHENHLVKQASFPVKAVDTTAAGDTFTGFFISAKLHGKSVADCLKAAAKAASISVGRMGASSSIPTIDEVLSAR